MQGQTISLYRYLMLGILGRRFYLLVGILGLVAIISASFLGELTIINRNALMTAFVADFLRYSLALLILLTIAASVAEDYEFRQFERLLTMPLARWQYIAAQVLVIASLSTLLSVPAALLLSIYGEPWVALYWAAALWLEFFLLGTLGLLAILSLEKIPQAVFFALAVYLLAKLSGLISLIVSESVKLAEASVSSRVVEWIFSAILYVMPGTEAFAESDVLFAAQEAMTTLATQAAATSIYVVLLLLVCLVDFYRKEFNL